MRRCGSCREIGHNKRSCRSKSRRKNPVSEVTSLTIKQAPVGKEIPLNTRRSCGSCSNLVAALLGKFADGQQIALQWLEECMECYAHSVSRYVSSLVEMPLKPKSILSRRSRKIGKCLLCNSATTEDKDYCIEHINQAPYVAELVHKIDEKEAEERSVANDGWETIKPQSLTANELLLLIGQKTMTVDGLARELNLTSAIVRAYTKFLERQGRVVVEGRNGKEFVYLSD